MIYLLYSYAGVCHTSEVSIGLLNFPSFFIQRQSMVFILTLLGVFMYIFAVAATVMFSNKSDRTDLEYKESFRYLNMIVFFGSNFKL